MNDSGIIRNRLKIEGAVKNAKVFLEAQKEFGSFDKYIWQFTPTLMYEHGGEPAMRSSNPESDAMSHDLKKRGFTFVGSTICYAYMQGAGIVNDHLVSCFRHKEVKNDSK